MADFSDSTEERVQTSAPEYQRQDDSDDLDVNRIILPHIRERILEDTRQANSIRGIILETVNILYREYGVRGLKYFRKRVEDADTLDELRIAADMLATVGRFQEIAGHGSQEVNDPPRSLRPA